MIVLKAKVPSKHKRGKRVWIKAKFRSDREIEMLERAMGSMGCCRSITEPGWLLKLKHGFEARGKEGKEEYQRFIQSSLEPALAHGIELLLSLVPEENGVLLRSWILSRRDRQECFSDLIYPYKPFFMAGEFNEWASRHAVVRYVHF